MSLKFLRFSIPNLIRTQKHLNLRVSRGLQSIRPAPFALARGFSAPAEPQDLASRMKKLLTEKLQATQVDVLDTSGGCGDFFRVQVISPLFKGKSIVQQHRMVNETLKSHITNMHGLTIATKASS